MAHVDPVAAMPAKPAWDDKSDCEPGAPPNSLANALDVMKVHCDRAKAYRRLGGLAAVALVGRFGGAGAAARGAAAASTAEAGLAGRAALSGARVAGMAGQNMDAPDDETDQAADASLHGPDEQYPVSVTDIGEGYFEVALSDGSTYRTDAEGAAAAVGHRGGN